MYPRTRSVRVVGGSNCSVRSSEVKHYFTPNGGIAAFVDAGNAVDGTDYRPKIGAGMGVRGRAPVGMIRVDLGTPVHSKDEHGIQLHIVIGPDL
ncbi:BamA/TamA family outer membrane protein [Fulvimonas soli]|uniref:BamA/TamA family outer membrane protein n=1 Tax=Fulvimonas soli TaxID=155197 RepID=UPI003CE5BE1B